MSPFSGGGLPLLPAAPLPPPGLEQFDAQAREVVQLLQVEALAEAIHEAVLWVQTETHGPQDPCVVLAQVLKGVHQLVQVRVGVNHICRHDVVETVRGPRETLLHLWAPGELGDLETQRTRDSTF